MRNQPTPYGKHTLKHHASGMILLTALSGITSNVSAEHIAISAGSLATALNRLAENSDLQLVYDTAMTAGFKSPGIQGDFTPNQALGKLLQGTGLTHSVSGDGTILIAAAPKTETAVPMEQSLPQKAAEPTLLKPMTVTAEAENEDRNSLNDPYNDRYSLPNAYAATKTNIPIFDTPMNIQVVPKGIIDDQQDIRIEDAITKNVSGVQRAYAYGDLYEEFTIRGFSNNFSTYRNGLRRYTNYSDPANIEQIEILKGPAAVLFGRIQPGGMVNIVTKKAQDIPYYSLQQQFGSYGQYRTTAAATGPLDKAGTLKYRLDMSYQDIGSNKKFINDERVFFAPKMNWTPNNHFEANLELEYKHEKRVNDLGIPAIGNRPAPIPLNTYLGDSAKGPVMDTVLVAFDWAYKLNENWQIKNRFLHENWDIQYYDTQPNGLHTDNRTMDRFAVTGAASHETYATNLDLTGKFELLGTKHDVLIGGDYSRFVRRAKDNRFACCNGSTAVPPIDIYNPTYGIVSQATVNASPYDYNTLERNEWFGIYFQDQITLWDKLHILGGGRYDWAAFGRGSDFNDDGTFTQALANYQGTHNQKFSPRVGLVYQPMQWLSLYGNWTESLGSANTGIAFGNQQFKPEIGEQFEGGFKTEFFDKRLSTTVAYYHLTKSNTKTKDPNHPNFQISSGEARSQGIEVDIKGQITEQFNLVATYAFTDARYTKSNNGLTGKRIENIPEHQASLWGTYQFTPKFKAGIGGVAVGQREGDNSNSYQLPGYVRMDLMAAYIQPFGETRLTTQLNINNVLDKDYYAGTDGWVNVVTGNPLAVMGSLKLEF